MTPENAVEPCWGDLIRCLSSVLQKVMKQATTPASLLSNCSFCWFLNVYFYIRDNKTTKLNMLIVTRLIRTCSDELKPGLRPCDWRVERSHHVWKPSQSSFYLNVTFGSRHPCRHVTACWISVIRQWLTVPVMLPRTCWEKFLGFPTSVVEKGAAVQPMSRLETSDGRLEWGERTLLICHPTLIQSSNTINPDRKSGSGITSDVFQKQHEDKMWL